MIYACKSDKLAQKFGRAQAQPIRLLISQRLNQKFARVPETSNLTTVGVARLRAAAFASAAAAAHRLASLSRARQFSHTVKPVCARVSAVARAQFDKSGPSRPEANWTLGAHTKVVASLSLSLFFLSLTPLRLARPSSLPETKSD